MRPPRLARALLRLLLPSTLADVVEGDLLEGLQRRAETPWRARVWFWKEVLSLPYASLARREKRIRGRARGPGPRRLWEGGMGGKAMDVRVAARALHKRPGYAAVTVVTLAASIGSVTLLFSVLRGVLLRPLPYDDPAALVTIYGLNEEWRAQEGPLRALWDRAPVALAQVEAWRSSSGVVSSVGAYQPFTKTLRVGDVEEEIAGASLDAGVMETLGVAPALGRLPSTAELEAGDPVAVVSDLLWETRFGGDPGAIGRDFKLEGTAYTLIGVMPADFFFPDESHAVWAPVSDTLREAAGDTPVFRGIARLERGVSLDAAGQALDAVARRVGADRPILSSFGARVVSYREELFDSVQTGLRLLMGATLLVLLMACVNLAMALLARGLERRRELAVRCALGQRTGSIVATALAEVVVLTALGGMGGALLAVNLLDPFVTALDATLGGLPRAALVKVDVPVLLFALATTVLTAVASGLLPALGAARRAPASFLVSARGDGGQRGVARSQKVLLFVQAALVMVLVAASALLLRSFERIMALDPGYDTRGIAWVTIEAPGEEDRVASVTVDDILRRVRSLPGVTAATATTMLPGTGAKFFVPVRLSRDEPVEMGSIAVSAAVEPAYFVTLGTPLVAGLGFAPGDQTVEPAVVDELLATRLFGGEDPLGKRFFIGAGSEPTELVVVGVSAATRQLSLVADPLPQYVRPLAGRARSEVHIVARADGRAGALVDGLRGAVVGSPVVVTEARTLRSSLVEVLRPARLRLVLVGGFSVVALGLALLGIFGVVTRHLAALRREIGIRIALGAWGPTLTRRVVASALAPTVAGLGVGAFTALLIAGRLRENFLYDLPPTDPLAYAAAGGLVLLVAFGASWVPARGATRVDPVEVLAEE